MTPTPKSAEQILKEHGERFILEIWPRNEQKEITDFLRSALKSYGLWLVEETQKELDKNPVRSFDPSNGWHSGAGETVGHMKKLINKT